MILNVLIFFCREFHGEHVNKFIQSDATGLAAVLQPTTTKDHVSLLCFFAHRVSYTTYSKTKERGV